MTIILIAAAALLLLRRVRALGPRVMLLGVVGVLAWASLDGVAARADLAPVVYLFAALAMIGLLIDMARGGV